MTPNELLQCLSDQAEAFNDFHDGLNGYLSWRVEFPPGERPVVTVWFDDAETEPFVRSEAAFSLIALPGKESG